MFLIIVGAQQISPRIIFIDALIETDFVQFDLNTNNDRNKMIRYSNAS